jgi:hypothetical protein
MSPSVEQRDPGARHHTINIIIGNVLISRDTMSKFENKDSVIGQQGDYGHGAVNNAAVVDTAGKIDLGEFAEQLSMVRAAMKQEAPDASEDDEADTNIGIVAQADKALRNNEPSKAVQLLKGVGTWTAKVAESVGAKVITDIIEGKIGGA